MSLVSKNLLLTFIVSILLFSCKKIDLVKQENLLIEISQSDKIIHTDIAEIDLMEKNIIIYRMNKISPNLKQIDYFCKKRLEICNSIKGKYVAIGDVSQAKLNFTDKGWLDLAWRTYQFQEKYKDKEIKNYIVIRKPILRKLVKNLTKLSKPIIPSAICKSLEEALKLAKKDLIGL